ncbi:MAG TPA: hypothetical protein VGV60_01945 [Candidatus Polarisedimenticolia bacterium]|jgi:hypothetical protein|nr:hypothetical protein [Candidatus Polarisedimenticolia bacterium]
MSEDIVQVREQASTASALPADPEVMQPELIGMLPGLRPASGDPVRIAAPGIAIREDEADFQQILAGQDPETRMRRRGLLEQIHALLELDRSAREKGLTLAESAREQADVYRDTMEAAWVTLLEGNRQKEEAVRYAALTFENMQNARDHFRDKIFAINASADEIASDIGCRFLADELSRYVDKPDPRKSRAFLLVQGWVGGTTKLKRLARVVHEHRCILFSDAPSYDSLDKLRRASAEGGLLETLPGDEVDLRHAGLIANKGLVRQRIEGRHAAEKQDVYISLSGPWFGMYLDLIAQGKPWQPPDGYMHPIAGVQGVLLDLRLKDKDHSGLYGAHRLNPAITLSEGSNQVVVWGPYMLSRSGGGVQIGMAVVEMRLIRYTEWIVNKYGLLHDLEEAQRVVEHKLSDFMVLNTGVDRMFRDGSRAKVTTDEAKRSLMIDFELYYREITERAEIRLSKPLKKEKLGEYEIR